MGETLPQRLRDSNTLSVIYCDGNEMHHAHMDAKTARTTNIRALVAQYGGPTKFTEKSGDWSQAQVSQWISEANPKGIGHALARKIERTLGLPGGWMDQWHGSATLENTPAPPPVDHALLVRSINAAQSAFARAGMMASLGNVAELSTCIYTRIAQGRAEADAARIADEFLADMITNPRTMTNARARRRLVRIRTEDR